MSDTLRQLAEAVVREWRLQRFVTSLIPQSEFNGLIVAIHAALSTRGEKVLVDKVMTVDEVWQGKDTQAILNGLNNLDGSDTVRVRVTAAKEEWG